jgi:DNA-binding transcriptional MerR regulator
VAVTKGNDGDRVPSTRTPAVTGPQDTLFDDSEVPGLLGDPGIAAQTEVSAQSQLSSRADGASDEIGYRGPTACSAAGITYRQLDYWARTGLVEPTVRAAHGSGSQRLYSFRDILVLKVVKRLLDTGISLQQIRAAVQHLRDRGSADLAQVTLMSDGVSVYECTSADEVVDLLAGGQGVFGIALGRVWREVEGDLAVLPAVRAEDGLVAMPPGSTGFTDDLAKRRLRRTSLFTARQDRLAEPASHNLVFSRVNLQVPMKPAGRVTAKPRAPKGQHPRNLSGTRTGRNRQL